MNDINKYRGCLIGGAVGDALGYPIEFLDASSIFSQFGEKGVTEYALQNGIARISDDTQMTLFTATGLLLGRTRAMTRGIMGSYPSYIYCNYKDWYKTQTRPYPLTEKFSNSWLVNIPEMFSRRAPGNTCLSALANSAYGTIDKPINQSKGCGGVMRVAPIGLYFNDSKSFSTDEIDMIGAQAAALTHGHSLGYIPAAGLVHIVNLVSHSDEISILEAVEDMKTAVSHLFADNEYIDEFLNIIDKAVKLSANENISDLDAVEEIGQGWVAEEALAIAIYCSLKYHNDFAKAITASVNHGGDSDSTGAITGSIVGAHLGLSGIDKKYLDNLELKDVIIEIADDLFYDCKIAEYSSYHDEIWEKKYIYKTYKPDKNISVGSTEITAFLGFEKLQKKVERLKTEHSMLLLERDELKFVTCRNIEVAYMLELGGLEYKAYKAQCDFLRIKRKYELIQAKINRQENIVISKIEDTLNQEFEEYKVKLDILINKMNEAIEYNKSDTLTIEESREIKKIYRKIVKSLHPDLNPNITEAQKQLFKNAVEAYKNGDIKTIRIIGETVDDSAFLEQSADTVTVLKENVQRLEKMIAFVKKDIINIKNSYPYTMKEIIDDEQKTENRKKEIENIINQYNNGISFYTAKIDEVLK